ncbi:hypothetical protein BaRGS_00017842 [Batillaria attramentaria]|uniref:Uncharacterized protein n=1 Tax=Batillaria attramentaria TaxID=370345 RepID=A0ABD0KUY8_9CAEN
MLTGTRNVDSQYAGIRNVESQWDGKRKFDAQYDSTRNVGLEWLIPLSPCGRTHKKAEEESTPSHHTMTTPRKQGSRLA